ncbi:uncharacterized protein B0I36DRAFT_364512 [Microdochium trichocladiopsis]|uniref:Apple domain-containing protein n=1 Tax=Microdochium trichocladiopsis TaxID=1682393 RepID=A0A9P8Y1A8_9PEZI|nr:uncharacterized protein B0I36DRAFT_364512 [Microdochium trichocladiopsis]KAH7027286.1 hypothetical protein B0I36DRAFT_364512 [Microdochium trichocladiopsis]
MSDRDMKHGGGHADAASGLQHVDYSSQYPEVVSPPSLPEVVPEPRYYDHPHQQHQHHHQQWDQQQWAYPPPPPSDRPTSAYPDSQAGWTSVSQRDPYPASEGDKSAAAAASSPKTILGVRRRVFWCIIGPLLVILGIGLGVGLGVGLSSKKPSSVSSGATPSSYPPAPDPLTCPAGNGTLYTEPVANGGDSFLVVCNVDYNGNNPSSGTTDLASTTAATVYQCINTCSGNSECAGAWFGDLSGKKWCFLKSRLGVQGPSAGNAIFVIRQAK